MIFCGTLLANSGFAQPLHRYVNIGETALPEPGSPLAVVFVDAGAASSDAGGAAADAIYALSPSGPIGGQPTTHAVFRYEIKCAAPSLRVLSVSTFGPARPPKIDQVNEAAHGPAAGSLDPAILKTVCPAGAAATGGYATLDDVLSHARRYADVRALSDDRMPHRFVTVGAVAASAASGPADVFIDTQALQRQDHQVTAQVLTVFRRKLDAASVDGNYVVATVEYACDGRTHRSRFTTLYKPDGALLQAGLVDAAAERATAGALDDKALKLVCEGADPGLGVPQASLAKALRVAWRDLSRPARGQ